MPYENSLDSCRTNFSADAVADDVAVPNVSPDPSVTIQPTGAVELATDADADASWTTPVVWSKALRP